MSRQPGAEESNLSPVEAVDSEAGQAATEEVRKEVVGGWWEAGHHLEKVESLEEEASQEQHPAMVEAATEAVAEGVHRLEPALDNHRREESCCSHGH